MDFASGFAHPRNVFALSLLVVPTLAVFADKSTVPTLLVALVLALPGAWLRGWRPTRPPIGSLALAAAAAGWAGITSLWSFDPIGGVSTNLRALSLIVAAWLLSDIAVRVPDARDPHNRGLARCAVIGLAAAAAVLIVEMLFDMAIKTAITGLWEDGRPDASETNRGGTFILIAVWLIVPLTALATDRPRTVGLGLFALAFAAIAIGESGTNQLGLLVALAFFGLAWLGRTVRLALWAGALVGLIAMPLLAQGLFDAGVHEIDQIPGSGRHRVHIWNYVSDWALERPWTGWGYDTSADFDNRGVEPWPGFSDVIPLHPHNAALQIWLELGIVGIVLACALMLRVARGTEAAGPAWAPWLGAAAISAYVAANLGYGIWQMQWIAALAWLVCYARLAVAMAPGAWERQAQPGSRKVSSPSA